MSYGITQTNRLQSNFEVNDLTVPLIDDSVIANIDSLIASFQYPNTVKTEENLSRSLNELKKIKELLHKINIESTSNSSCSLNYSSDENEARSSEMVRKSIEMIKNGGKFVKPINETNSSSSGSTNSSLSHKLSPKLSLSSLKSAINVTACKPTRRPSNNCKKVTRKYSRSALPTKSDVKINKQKVNDEKFPSQSTPKIVKTFHATCRIHQYDDNSHTFEIINPKSVSCRGDSADLKSEIVIVVLANLDTALFVSNHSSLLDVFNRNGNRVKKANEMNKN